MTAEEAEARDAEAYARQMALDADAFAAPSGEDTPQLLHPVRRFYEPAVARHKLAENVLIVAHGGSIRALLVCLLGLPDDWSGGSGSTAAASPSSGTTPAGASSNFGTTFPMPLAARRCKA